MFCAEMTIFIRGKKKNRNGRMFMVIYKITSIKLYFVGFNSVSSFNRHFKKIIGSKPMQWRKEREIVKSTQILKYNGWILPPEQMEMEERSEGIV